MYSPGPTGSFTAPGARGLSIDAMALVNSLAQANPPLFSDRMKDG